MAPASQGGPAGWTSGGPYGGHVNSLAIDPAAPGTLYASSSVGVAKSTDFGATWRFANTGLVEPTSGPLGIDPANPDTVYVGVSSYGMFKSTNGGASWASVGLGMVSSPQLGAQQQRDPRLPPPRPTVTAIAIDPTAPSTVYAGVALSPTFASGVYKSTDSGSSWARVGGSLDGPTVLIIDPSQPSTLYGAWSFDGVLKSTDSGNSWVSNGYNGSATALALDPSSSNIVYAGIYAGTVPSGLYKSTNAGTSFELFNTGLESTTVRSLVVDPSTPTTVYVGTSLGVFKSTNAGGNWTPASAGFTKSVSCLAIDPLTPTTIYACSQGEEGAFKSTDSGATWASTNQGLTNASAYAVASVPAAPGTLYAGGRAGMFKSTDAGTSWVSSGLTSRDVRAIVVDQTPATLFAGTTTGLMKSTDAGGTWAGPTLGGDEVLSLAADPAAPATLYAGVANGLRKSTDSGSSWAFLTCPCGGDTDALAVHPTTTSTIFAGTTQAGVLRSTNSGVTWFQVNSGLTNLAVGSLAIDPTTPATIYAGTSIGVFRSNDSGGNWAPTGPGLPLGSVVALVIDPAAPGTIYAGVPGRPPGGGGVFRSTDAGATWSNVSLRLPVPRSVRGLALDAGGALFAAFSERSVWQASALPAPFAKGDLNQDGLPDLLLRASNGVEHQAWLMNGVVRTSAAALSPDAPSADWKVRGVDDFSGDGVIDLLLWNQVTGQAEFWFMNGTQRLGTAPLTADSFQYPSAGWDLAATADFTHDGMPDLLWRDPISQGLQIRVLYGTHTSGGPAPTPSQAADANWITVAALDYNHDGNTDLLWYNYTSGKLVIWYMNASIVRTSGQFTTPNAAGNANWKVVASSDYSGGSGPGTPPLGSPDVVWRNETSGKQVVWHLDFNSTRVYGEFTNPAANSPALDWTIVGPR